jgi:aminoglycoside phosphotransferase (APT) family kinase protein
VSGANIATIDEALVRRLVADQFPAWANLQVRAVDDGGWDNRTFRLGQTLLARLPSGGAYAAQVEKEQRWLPRLAPRLPLPIPEPVGLGRPAEGYPWPWSVYRWIDGVSARRAKAFDPVALAAALAGFLNALQAIDAGDGPRPGAHNFHRGAPLAMLDRQTRAAISAFDDRTAARTATAVWEAALADEGRGPAVWVHGDIAAGNLLIRDGALAAVIDFGTLGVGDPAGDLVIAWTLFDGPARARFRAGLALDAGTWARARGWALWKAAILATGLARGHRLDIADAPRILASALAEGV